MTLYDDALLAGIKMSGLANGVKKHVFILRVALYHVTISSFSEILIQARSMAIYKVIPQSSPSARVFAFRTLRFSPAEIYGLLSV